MTEKSLKVLIDRLNHDKTDGLLHLRPLSATVDFAKVWIKKPKQSDDISYPDGPYKVYFIKNETGIYVAAVLDMGSDLHWYVRSTDRGKGHLTNALKATILCHLLQDRDEQTITINRDQIGDNNFKSSERVAFSVGFVKTDDKQYQLKKEMYPTDRHTRGRDTTITEDRMNNLKKQVNYFARSLWVIQTELEMKLGVTDYSEELKQLVDEIKEHTWRLEDAWWDSKKQIV